MPNEPHPYGYEPSLPEKIRVAIVKNAPAFIGRVIQTILYGIFNLWRFLIQMFKDAIGH